MWAPIASRASPKEVILSLAVPRFDLGVEELNKSELGPEEVSNREVTNLASVRLAARANFSVILRKAPKSSFRYASQLNPIFLPNLATFISYLPSAKAEYW